MDYEIETGDDGMFRAVVVDAKGGWLGATFWASTKAQAEADLNRLVSGVHAFAENRRRGRIKAPR